MKWLLPIMLLTPLLRGQEQPQPPRPNLLVIVTDDQRFDQMGCAGHPTLKTPVMDRLAERGVMFRNSFVTTAICAASRASIMTGRRESAHGYTFGKPPMDQGIAADTYFAQLHDAGYRTGFVGKWGVRFAPDALGNALDVRRAMSAPYRRDGKAHLTDRTAESAVDFISAHQGDQPFCLSISFNAPHAQDDHEDQFLPPADLAALYEDAAVPTPPLADSGFAALPEFLKDILGSRALGVEV